MDDRALLAAVLDDPDDDLPRLAYADWLEENGDETRASFIRAQIELTRLPRSADRFAELRMRCRKLERRYAATWLTESPEELAVDGFERGFPSRVRMPQRTLAQRVLRKTDFDRLRRVLAVYPVREFRGDLLGAVMPTMMRFPQATIYPERGESPLELLARWQPLRRFTTLDLGRGGITLSQGDFEPGIEALSASPFAAGLQTLRLSGLLLGENAIHRLAESPYLGQLKSLDLRYNVPLLDRPGELLGTGLADRLEEVDGLDLETAGRWLHRPGCKLRSLGITIDPHREPPEVTDAAPLLHAPGLAKLRRLTLHFDGPAAWQERAPERDEVLRVEHLIPLLASPLLEQLEELHLCGVGMHDGEVVALPFLPALRNLVSLSLKRCLLNGALVSHLRPLLGQGKLRRLDLTCNGLNNAGARMLAEWPELVYLHVLLLDLNDIDEQGYEAIRRSPHRNEWLHLSRGEEG